MSSGRDDLFDDDIVWIYPRAAHRHAVQYSSSIRININGRDVLRAVSGGGHRYPDASVLINGMQRAG
jgi:hypothetical protein